MLNAKRGDKILCISEPSNFTWSRRKINVGGKYTVKSVWCREEGPFQSARNQVALYTGNWYAAEHFISWPDEIKRRGIKIKKEKK